MRKFKVGDKIIGIKNNGYSYTNDVNVSTVTELHSKGKITVEVDGDYGRETYNVDSTKFVLVTSKITPKFAIGDTVTNQYGDTRVIKATILMYETEGGFTYRERHLTEYAEPEVVEVTMAEIEAKYGMKVKVIK